MPPPSPEEQEKLDEMIERHEQEMLEQTDKRVERMVGQMGNDLEKQTKANFRKMATERPENAGLSLDKSSTLSIGKAYAASDERHIKEALEELKPKPDLHKEAPEKLKSVKESLGVRKEITAKQKELKEAKKTADLMLKRAERNAQLAVVAQLEADIAELENKLPKKNVVPRTRKSDWERFQEVTNPKTKTEKTPVLPGQDQDLPFETIDTPITPKEEQMSEKEKLASLINTYKVSTTYGPLIYTAAEKPVAAEATPAEEEKKPGQDLIVRPGSDVVPFETVPEVLVQAEAPPENPVAVRTEAGVPAKYEENPMQLMQNPVLNKIIMGGKEMKRKPRSRQPHYKESMSMGGTKYVPMDLSGERLASDPAPRTAPKKSNSFWKRAMLAFGIGSVAVGVPTALSDQAPAAKGMDKDGAKPPAAKSAQEAGVTAPPAASPSEAKPPAQTVKQSPEALKNKVQTARERDTTRNKVLAQAQLETKNPDSGISSDDVTMLMKWERNNGGFPPGADKNIRKVIEVVRANPDNPQAFDGIIFEPIAAPSVTKAPETTVDTPAAENSVPETEPTPEVHAEAPAPSEEKLVSSFGVPIDSTKPYGYKFIDENGKEAVVVRGGEGEAAFEAAMTYAATLPEGSRVRFDAVHVDPASGEQRPLAGMFVSAGVGQLPALMPRDPEATFEQYGPVDPMSFKERIDIALNRS